MYLIRIKSFTKNLIFGTSGAEFLYVLRKNNKRKQDVKPKKLYALEKSNLRNYAELVKDYTYHIADYTQPVKAG